MHVVRPEDTTRAVVPVLRRRQRGDRHRVLRRPHVDNECVERAFDTLLRVRFIDDNGEIAARQRERRMGAAWKRRRPVDVREQPRPRDIGEIVDGEAAVTPCRITTVAGRDHVVERDSPSCGKHRGLAGRPIHAGQPPARDDLRLRDLFHIDDAEDVVDEAVKMRGHVRIAPARPPQTVDAKARDLEKGDLLHLRRP